MAVQQESCEEPERHIGPQPSGSAANTRRDRKQSIGESVSGPKCGEYRVVSEAELRARRLAAAKSRFQRIRSDHLAEEGRASAATNTYGDLGVDELRVLRPKSEEPSEWEAHCHKLESRLAQFHKRLNEVISFRRTAAVIDAAKGLDAVEFAADEPRPKPVAESRSKIADEVARIVNRLPSDASDAIVADVERFVSDCLTRAPGAARDRTVLVLRGAIQQETDRARNARDVHRKVDRLCRRLDGLEENPEVRALLDRLDDARANTSIPAELESDVETTALHVEAEADRAFVLSVAQESLVSLGYRPEDELSTTIASGGSLMTLPGSTSHGLQIRENNDQLFFNIVKFGNSTQREDTSAEASFCDDFGKLRATLIEQGVEMSMLRADSPGETAMQEIDRGTQAARRRRKRQHLPRQRGER